MQGDIKLPGFEKTKAAQKPKLDEHHQEEQPDLKFDAPSFEPPQESTKKESKILVAPHKHFIRFWRFWLRLNRNERFAIIAALLLIFGVAAIGYYYFIQPASNPDLVLVRHPKPKIVAPATLPSPLTGVQVDPALTKRPVTGIMIENSVFARPQSGLQDAGVVYEAIAEGGITRFLALFQDAQPQYVGPVRSLRPYYIDFAAPFQASIAHVGGSPEALSQVRNGSYRDIDQFFNAGYYWRSSTRPAPHNMYTSFAKLDALNQKKGYATSLFTTWPRKADKKLATPTAKTIDIQISSADYYSHYDYDATNNVYLRSEGGAAHLDLVSADDKKGVRLQPKVVIALVMPYSLESDGKHSVYGDSGSGTSYVFQDGGLTTGKWEKAGTTGQISFKDSSGLPITLNAGQTWITLVAGTNKISYKP
jgi:hypothetical protein